MTSTTKKGYRVAKDVKEQILKRVKDEGINVSQASQEHGVSSQTIYAWLTKGTSHNPSWTEFAKLKRENRGLLELVGALTVKLSQAQKKQLIKDCSLNKTELARISGISRSMLYYEHKQPQNDWWMKQRIEIVLREHPSYGHKRLALHLEVNQNTPAKITLL